MWWFESDGWYRRFVFAMRYRKWQIVGTVTSMWQNRWTSISAVMSLRSYLGRWCIWYFGVCKTIVEVCFWVRSRIGIDLMIWNLPTIWGVWIRETLQEIVDCWNKFFDVAEEMDIDFCFYFSPFPSTMLTARHLHAAALPLKDYFYGPLRGRRSALPPSRYRSLKVGESEILLLTYKYV